MKRVAIIGGSGVYSLDDFKGTPRKVQTPYGEVECEVGNIGEKELVFLPRHGKKHSIPPHLINYQANIWALAELEVNRVMTTAAVGSLNEDYPPGSLVLLSDFLDFTRNRPSTFYSSINEGVVHTDFSFPYCPELAQNLKKASLREGIELLEGAVYVATDGPRFETPAEIRMYKHLGGDVVGMTGVPEVVLAHEKGICYASVAVVTNWAAGIKKEMLSHEEVLQAVAERSKSVQKIFRAVLPLLHEPPSCSCAKAANKINISANEDIDD